MCGVYSCERGGVCVTFSKECFPKSPGRCSVRLMENSVFVPRLHQEASVIFCPLMTISLCHHGQHVHHNFRHAQCVGLKLSWFKWTGESEGGAEKSSTAKKLYTSIISSLFSMFSECQVRLDWAGAWHGVS